MSPLENVALSVEAAEQARQLRSRLGFRELTDVIRLGVAVALRERLSAEPPTGASYNSMANYRTDAIDPEGHLRLAIRNLYTAEDAGRDLDEMLRVLMSRGVGRLAEAFTAGEHQTLSDVIGADPDAKRHSAG
jgi:hypothetical protein